MAPEEPPHSKQEETPLHKALTRSQQEAFSRDSQLACKVREESYQENCLHFNSENSCNLVDIFWNMIESAGLLGSKIYEIQETWTGRCELEYANYTLKTLPRGLKFFCPMSPSEFPKVMDLTNIHHQDALCHFSGETHCLWYRKEGQNEGMIVNHLQTMHYKFCLVWEVLSLPLSHIWGHQAPWPKELPAIHRRRPWWVIFISLTASIRLTGSIFQRWDLDGGSEGGSDICWTTTLGIPLPLKVELDGGLDEGSAFHQTNAYTSFQSSCILPRLQ